MVMPLVFTTTPLFDSIAGSSRSDSRVRMNEEKYITADKSTIGGAWCPGICITVFSQMDYMPKRQINTHLKKMYAARRKIREESAVEYTGKEAICNNSRDRKPPPRITKNMYYRFVKMAALIGNEKKAIMHVCSGLISAAVVGMTLNHDA